MYVYLFILAVCFLEAKSNHNVQNNYKVKEIESQISFIMHYSKELYTYFKRMSFVCT